MSFVTLSPSIYLLMRVYWQQGVDDKMDLLEILFGVLEILFELGDLVSWSSRWRFVTCLIVGGAVIASVWWWVPETFEELCIAAPVATASIVTGIIWERRRR